MQDQFVIVLGKDQIDTGPLEVSVEQQVGVGNDDRARRRMRRHRIDAEIAMGMRTRVIRGEPGVEFTGVIQGPPQKG